MSNFDSDVSTTLPASSKTSSEFSSTSEMYVTKRNGNKEIISFDKILQRIKKTGKEVDIKINYTSLAIKIIDQLFDGIPTDKIDEISAEQCATMSSIHYDYGTLASRLIISNHHRNTTASFVKTMKKLYSERMISDEFMQNVNANAKQLDALCDYTRDYLIDYFGFKTLERSYLMSIKKRIYERPQMMFLRLAISIHGVDFAKIQETYHALSNKQMIHGTPSLYNAGTPREQMSSCFLRDTSIHTIGGPVPIQDVKEGYKVVTHTGEVQTVSQVHENLLGNRSLYTMNFYQTRPFTVTEDHPLYVYDNETKEVVWKNVIDITTNDYVMIPKKNNQKFLNEASDPAKLAADTEINKFFGIWNRYGEFLYLKEPTLNTEDISDDVSFSPVPEPVPVGIQIVLPTDCLEAISFCYNLKKMFGEVRLEKADYDNGITVLRYELKKMADDFLSWFGKDRNIPQSLYQHPTHWVRSFLSGWNITGIHLTEEQVPDSIYTLCRINHLHHLTFLPLDYTECEEIIEYEGNLFLQYVSKEEYTTDIDTNTYVYTLGVETDHSYSVAGIIAKNCYLIAMESDSIEGIYNTLKDCALISKYAGGIGLHIHNIRATGSHIAGTNGISNGIVPMLRVFNNTAKYVDQCLHPKSIIYTTQGPTCIQNVVQGETKIFNQHGDVEVVQNVLEHSYEGTMLHINTEFSIDTLDITPEHPIFVLRGNGMEPHSNTMIESMLEKQLIEPIWIEASELDTTDLFAFPIPTYDCDVSSISEDDCYLYGLLLGDGEYVGRTTAVSNLKTYTPHMYEFVSEYLDKRCVKYTITHIASEKSDDIYEFSWVRPAHLPFRHNDLFDASMDDNRVRMSSRWLNLPIQKSQYILKGLLKSKAGDIGKNIRIKHFSKQIIECCRFICLKMGVLPQFNCASIGYWINIPPTKETCPLFDLIHDGRESPFVRHGNFMFSPIISVLSTQYSGVLYDLQMEKQHDYLLSSALVHNGGGKRNGSFAIYLEPWHADIELFLQMRKNHGEEELKARDLFYALWVPDLFMKRVKEAGKWTLFCPHECPGLADVHNEAFETLYTSYEESGKGRATLNARDLWFKILDAQMETGTPYLVYKDAANRKSNQQNLGTIKSSNLCVAPETLILIEKNNAAVFVPIQTQCGKRVNVWNGTEYSEVEIVKTGEMQPLIEVHTSTNNVLHCTPYHKFYILMDDDQKINIVEAQYLQEGDLIAPCLSPEFCEIKNAQRITKVIDNGRYDDTYCFSEPKKHAGIFNGIYTSQCSEIIEYSDENETSVCNLASIALPAFVVTDPSGVNPPTYDFEKLHHVARMATYNLNRIIDINYYPTEKTERSNKRHRPIGIGVQGLADTFMMMGYIFGSPESRRLNQEIFETMYHGSLTESCAIAQKEGAYETFEGSPASKGLLQFDLWDNTDPLHTDPNDPNSPHRYDWTSLKIQIQTYGLRNSLLLAPMPTASTSQILGYNECIEPITSNIYARRTLAGEFIVTNKYLMKELISIGLWNEKIKNHIVANNGSVQSIDIIPAEIREKYKTVWEIPMRTVIDMAAERGVYVCQSQSLNLWMEEPTYNSLTSMHFYSWSKGLKTGIYYLRRRARHAAQQFTIEPEKAQTQQLEEEEEICEMCSG